VKEPRVPPGNAGLKGRHSASRWSASLTRRTDVRRPRVS
jgi:hypothetical protein